MCFIPRKINPKRCGFLKIEGILANGWNDASLIVFERRVQELHDNDTKIAQIGLRKTSDQSRTQYENNSISKT